MIAFFCEECGGRNTFDANTLDSKERYFECRFCHELTPLPRIRDRAPARNLIDTKSFKILIVDDEEYHVDLLASMLENEYSIITATNGQQSIRLAHEANPDLILMDVIMPDLSGHEVCRKLKANKRTRHIPVIFVSSMADTVDEEKGFEAGAVDYITKPIKLSIVKARVAIHLELKRQLRRGKKENQKSNQSIKWLEQQVIQQQMAEAETRQFNADLEQTLDAADLIVLIQDVEKRIIHVNASAGRAFNKTYDEMIGRRCHEIFYGLSEPCENCDQIADISNSLKKPIKVTVEPLGKTFWMNRLPRFDENSALIGYIHVGQEISLSKMAGLFSLRDAVEEPASKMVQRGELKRANIDNLLTAMDALSTILLNNELIRKTYQNDENLVGKTEQIGNAISRASTLITETIYEASGVATVSS